MLTPERDTARQFRVVIDAKFSGSIFKQTAREVFHAFASRLGEFAQASNGLGRERYGECVGHSSNIADATMNGDCYV